MNRISLSKGEGIILRSPASFNTVTGEIEVWGRVTEKASILLEGIDLLITARTDSTIDVDGYYMKIREPIPHWWDSLPSYLVGKKSLFLGRTDSGKSSSILYLANKMVSEGNPVTLLNSDIGQSDLGPPGVISLKHLNSPVIHTKLLEPDFIYFIGDKTPVGHFLPMMKGILDALKESRTNTILINTTGFVDGGSARVLKNFKIEFTEPDVIVAIERKKGDLEHIIKNIPKEIEVKRVISPVYNTKSPSYRISTRKALIRKYLQDGHVRKFRLEEIMLKNTFIGTGIEKPEYAPILEDLLGVKVYWVEESLDMLIILTEALISKEKYIALSNLLNKDVKIAPLGDYRGLYVGLLKGKTYAGVGILESLDLKEGEIGVLTRYNGRVSGISFGYIRFNSEGEELGRRRRDYP